jgi:hypothetical protein
MRLLMLFVTDFAYRPGRKTLAEVPVVTAGRRWTDGVLAFVHAEPADAGGSGVVTKLVKNLKWAARKNNTQRIILHSFAHLGERRASPDVAASILEQTEQRLRDAGYAASQTPFGYLLDVELNAPGREFARIYKEF